MQMTGSLIAFLNGNSKTLFEITFTTSTPIINTSAILIFNHLILSNLFNPALPHWRIIQVT